ncbi:hypothetical protein CEUSTIGMA_g347.t1 [Chlamydomonas eustigma]|uniref:SAM domain-containing protein n=1 Tax=Chlamydomonas eustigma TaxID=1157962 RepID=A0A250WQE6_9CHLO|nr:hypothetical protein CEUSTIGMA_g347.t1 [Chlamydomonas eustigma]|eukprot:GAX72892.1 hypothetical protein CEUSTIGMA_g347.t1 [Chlamydomonas eustigma]
MSIEISKDPLLVFLQKLNLAKYYSLFKQKDVLLESLSALNESDLAELGLPLGPRRKIKASLLASFSSSVSSSYQAGYEASRMEDTLERRRTEMLLLEALYPKCARVPPFISQPLPDCGRRVDVLDEQHGLRHWRAEGGGTLWHAASLADDKNRQTPNFFSLKRSRGNNSLMSLEDVGSGISFQKLRNLVAEQLSTSNTSCIAEGKKIQADQHCTVRCTVLPSIAACGNQLPSIAACGNQLNGSIHESTGHAPKHVLEMSSPDAVIRALPPDELVRQEDVQTTTVRVTCLERNTQRARSMRDGAKVLVEACPSLGAGCSRVQKLTLLVQRQKQEQLRALQEELRAAEGLVESLRSMVADAQRDGDVHVGDHGHEEIQFEMQRNSCEVHGIAMESAHSLNSCNVKEKGPRAILALEAPEVWEEWPGVMEAIPQDTMHENIREGDGRSSQTGLALLEVSASLHSEHLGQTQAQEQLKSYSLDIWACDGVLAGSGDMNLESNEEIWNSNLGLNEARGACNIHCGLTSTLIEILDD